jgi:repressor LexA
MKELTTSQEKVLSFITACQKAHGSPPTIREIAQHFGYRSINNVRQHLRLIERKGYIRLNRGKARGVEVITGFGAEPSESSEPNIVHRVLIRGSSSGAEPSESSGLSGLSGLLGSAGLSDLFGSSDLSALSEEGEGIQVPLVGSVPAGEPITAIENREGSITLDSNLFKGPGLFTLRVRGESMKGVGILNGDIAIIRQQQSAESGDIVVALINGEATLKRYIRQNGKIIFHAENPEFADITIPAEQPTGHPADQPGGDFAADRAEVTIAGKLIGILRKV